MKRNWTTVGAEYHEGETRFGESRSRVERAIAKLKWKPVPDSLPMMPGLGIKAAIKELRLPKVSKVAINGYLQMPDGPESAHYAIYGIEANYANGRARIYVLDTGTGLVVLASDFWEKELAA